jgi:hypothetical protein
MIIEIRRVGFMFHGKSRKGYERGCGRESTLTI